MRYRMAQLHDQIPPYFRGPEQELTIFRNAMRNVPFADAILATEPVSGEDLEQKLALRIQNTTEHLPIEPKDENSATNLVKKLAEVLNVGSSYGRPSNNRPYNRPYSKANKYGNKTSAHSKNSSHQNHNPRQNPIKRSTRKPRECAFCGSRLHLVYNCPDCPQDERETYRRKAMYKATNTVEMPAAINSQLRQAMAEEVYYDDPTDTCSTEQDDSRHPECIPYSDDASNDVNFISVSTNLPTDVDCVAETEGAQFHLG